MSNHTPYPWHVEDGYLVGPGDTLVADVMPLRAGELSQRPLLQEQTANWRVLAAAPLMLAVLDRLNDDGDLDDFTAGRMVYAVVSAARGEEGAALALQVLLDDLPALQPYDVMNRKAD